MGVVVVPGVAAGLVVPGVVVVRVVSVVTELLVFESAPVRDTSEEPVQEEKIALAQNPAAKTRMANNDFFVSFIRPCAEVNDGLAKTAWRQLPALPAVLRGNQHNSC